LLCLAQALTGENEFSMMRINLRHANHVLAIRRFKRR
jgi:hypothetical protein